MPPKKRKAAVAVEETVDASKPKSPRVGPVTAASGRTKRSSTTKVAPTLAKKETVAAPSGEKKKRGRPSKSPTSSVLKPAPAGIRKRGRPPKAASAGKVTESRSDSVKAPRVEVKKRGRPSKSSIIVTKSEPKVPQTATSMTVKKRGRPKKSTPKDADPTDGETTAPDVAPKEKASTKTGVKRGRDPKTSATNQGKEATNKAIAKDDNEAGIKDDSDGSEQETVSYWLMKAEPESRIEKGVDVKFSIDDLEAASEPQGWDGVRNFVGKSRNNMRAMKKGDQAFFAHSNCKVPGIAGIMEIVQEHSVDESAFDHKHPYFDEKSIRDKPKWSIVHVEFRSKFPKLISLPELRAYAKPGQPLEDFNYLKQSRLSVSRVKPDEWKFIMNLLHGGAGSNDSETDDEETTLENNSTDSLVQNADQNSTSIAVAEEVLEKEEQEKAAEVDEQIHAELDAELEHNVNGNSEEEVEGQE